MATSTQLPVEDYLRMSFEPDSDYVDGRVVERNVGGLKHSTAQGEFIGMICDRAPGLDVRPSVRMQTAPYRYRVADVAVFEGEPEEEYPSTLPLLTLEVAAPDDNRTGVLIKLREYRDWGVQHIWLADPYSEKLHMFGSEGLREVHEFVLPEHDLRISRQEWL